MHGAHTAAAACVRAAHQTMCDVTHNSQHAPVRLHNDLGTASHAATAATAATTTSCTTAAAATTAATATATTAAVTAKAATTSATAATIAEAAPATGRKSTTPCTITHATTTVNNSTGLVRTQRGRAQTRHAGEDIAGHDDKCAYCGGNTRYGVVAMAHQRSMGSGARNNHASTPVCGRRTHLVHGPCSQLKPAEVRTGLQKTTGWCGVPHAVASCVLCARLVTLSVTVRVLHVMDGAVVWCKRAATACRRGLTWKSLVQWRRSPGTQRCLLWLGGAGPVGRDVLASSVVLYLLYGALWLCTGGGTRRGGCVP
jgi:hypothetical protein